MEIDALTWEVLNATADDWESLESIGRMIGQDVPKVMAEDISDAVTRLLVAGMFEQQPEGARLSDGWFRMTPHGRAVWQGHASRFIDVA